MKPGEGIMLLAVYFAAIVFLVAAMLAVSFPLGQRHTAAATVQPFESGIATVGDARVRFPAQFYLVAMLFVIFDLEAVFVYAWAVSAHEVGWVGYVEILVFITILLAALVYLWRAGALDWTPRRSRRLGLEAEAVKVETDAMVTR